MYLYVNKKVCVSEREYICGLQCHLNIFTLEREIQRESMFVRECVSVCKCDGVCVCA